MKSYTEEQTRLCWYSRIKQTANVKSYKESSVDVAPIVIRGRLYKTLNHIVL